MTRNFLPTLLSRQTEPAQEIELTEADLRPKPITGPDIDRLRVTTESNIEKLKGRREVIASEIKRLEGELANSDIALKSQEAALAALGPKPATPTRLPRAAQMVTRDGANV